MSDIVDQEKPRNQFVVVGEEDPTKKGRVDLSQGFDFQPETKTPAFDDIDSFVAQQKTAAKKSFPEVDKAIATVPKPTIPGEKSFLLRPEERTGTQMVAAPEAPNAPAVRLGNMVPQAAVPALQGFQKHVNEPLDRAAQAGAAIASRATEPIQVTPGAGISGWRVAPEGTLTAEHPIAGGIEKGIAKTVRIGRTNTGKDQPAGQDDRNSSITD